MPTNTFADIFRKAMAEDDFWVETAILDFTLDLHAEMKRQRKTNADLAAIIGSSPAYITKVFRGEANFTIKSMVKLSRALGCQLHLKVSHSDYKISWFNAPMLKDARENTPIVTTSDSYHSEGLTHATDASFAA